MNNDKLTLGGIIGVGVLATSLVIGAETSTYATMLEPELYLNSENSHVITIKDSVNFGNIYNLSILSEQIKIGMDIDEEEPTEIEIIEIPVIKRMVFQFNRPVKLEFS